MIARERVSVFFEWLVLFSLFGIVPQGKVAQPGAPASSRSTLAARADGPASWKQHLRALMGSRWQGQGCYPHFLSGRLTTCLHAGALVLCHGTARGRVWGPSSKSWS